MPTTKTCINISIPAQIETVLLRLAKRDQVPVATKALELIKEALELEEDEIHSKITDIRFTNSHKWHSHDEVWQKLTK